MDRIQSPILSLSCCLMAGPSVRKPAMITLSRSHVSDHDVTMMMSDLLAVKGASSGGCSLCPGRMPRLDSSSWTEAPARESALRPLAATSLRKYKRITYQLNFYSLFDMDIPEMNVNELHWTCSLKE